MIRKLKKVEQLPRLKQVQKKQRHNAFLLNSLIALLLFAVFSEVYQYGFNEKLNLNGDNASYILLGKSIASGKGYTLFNDLMGTPHHHFPPGYPLIIAFLLLFKQHIIWLKIANGLFFFGSLVLSFHIFQKLKVGWPTALVTTLLLVFNYHLVKSSVIIMSEISFLFFSLLSLWLFLKVDFQKHFLKNKFFYFFLLSLSLTFHIRTIGIAIFAGMLLYLIIEKHWKGVLASLSGFILLALPWIIRGKILGLSNSYQTQLLNVNPYRPEMGTIGWSDLLTRISNNSTRYITKELQSSILPFMEINYKTSGNWQEWTLGISILLLGLWGIWKLPKYRMLIGGYLTGTFGILLLWPDVWIGTRFLLPVLPIMMLLLVYAISCLLEKVFELIKFKTSYTAFLLLPFLLLYVQKFKPNKDSQFQTYPLTRLNVEAKSPRSDKWKRYIEVAEYVKKNIDKSNVIACRKPQLFHLFSERYTCLYPLEKDDKKLMAGLKKKQVKYVIVDQLGYSSTNKYLIPAIRDNPRNFKVILELKNPNTYLVQFFPPQ